MFVYLSCPGITYAEEASDDVDIIYDYTLEGPDYVPFNDPDYYEYYYEAVPEDEIVYGTLSITLEKPDSWSEEDIKVEIWDDLYHEQTNLVLTKENDWTESVTMKESDYRLLFAFTVDSHEQFHIVDTEFEKDNEFSVNEDTETPLVLAEGQYMKIWTDEDTRAMGLEPYSESGDSEAEDLSTNSLSASGSSEEDVYEPALTGDAEIEYYEPTAREYSISSRRPALIAAIIVIVACVALIVWGRIKTMINKRPGD